MSPRILIAYYSMTGNTQQLSRELRAQLGNGVDEERIREPRERRGLIGTLRSTCDVMLRREPSILPPAHLPGDYDLLVLGGPLWAGRLAGPVRAYARQYGTAASRVAFFCTQGGSDPAPAFAELQRLCHRAPRATLAINRDDLAPTRHARALRHFIRSVQLA